jgi:hypothetical protein
MHEDETHPAKAEEMNIFSHSGDIGDIIAALPVIRQLGGGELHLFPAIYTGFRMTKERVANLRPFLELQPYISRVEWCGVPICTNLDNWRNHYQHGLNLTDILAEHLHQPHPDRVQPWLRVDEVRREARVVFARSQRWRNDTVDWKAIYDEYHEDAVFVGTKDEHDDFQRMAGPVPFVPTHDYLQLARIVAGAELVCVNQTSIRWLAEGLKVPVVVEALPNMNNTHWERVGAYYLYGPGDYFPDKYRLEQVYYRTLVQRAKPFTLLSEDRLENIAQLVRSVEDLPGDMAEVGTYRGGSAMVISAANPNKKLHVFDTFRGIPEADEYGHHQAGDFAADLDSVRTTLELSNVAYYVGIFPRTTKELPGDQRYCFVHLDGDTYQTTKNALAYFMPRMVEDGVIVLDDYDWHACPGVRRACEEMGISQVCVEGQHGWVRA